MAFQPPAAPGASRRRRLLVGQLLLPVLTSVAWPYWTAAALGAFHGLNPAMGWLFAAALVLHRQRPAALPWALAAIALGHTAGVALEAGAVLTASQLIPLAQLRLAAAFLLLLWASLILLRNPHRRVRVGMTAGFLGLAAWSFLMASAHGAGWMLAPALLPFCTGSGGLAAGAGLLAVHTAALIATQAALTLLVTRRIGLAPLRRAWINLDWLWAGSLALTGLALLR